MLLPSVHWCCWLGSRKGIRTQWWGVGMIVCLQWSADLHMAQSCHCHSLFLASVKSRLVLPFWYRLTRVVPDKGPLKPVCGCVVTFFLFFLVPSVLWRCWLGGRKGIWPVKNCVVGCWAAGMVICLERGADACIWPSWCHCHSLSLASIKSRLVLPFWYRLTRVVPEKGLLNGCVCVCVCVVVVFLILGNYCYCWLQLLVLMFSSRPKVTGTHFVSAAVPVDSSHMTASLSASWSRSSPPSNVVNGHVVHGLSLATITGRWLGETPFVQVSLTWAWNTQEVTPCQSNTGIGK